MTFENIITELAIILAGAALLSTLFLFLKQPIIISYIVLGMIIGPYGLGLIKDADHLEKISHVGIILLLFLIGLNLHPYKLLALFKNCFGNNSNWIYFCPVVSLNSICFRI